MWREERLLHYGLRRIWKGAQKMANEASKIAAALSGISLVGVAFISVFGTIRIESIKNDTAALDRQLQQQEINLKQQVFEAEEKSRTRAILTEWIPKLISGGDSEQKTARAILFVLFPNNASTYVTLAFESLSEIEKEEQAETIAEVLEQAEVVGELVGPWTIVIGSDSDSEAAEFEVKTILELEDGFTPVRIYHRNDLFATTVGDFATQTQAESAVLAVRDKVRNSAFVVDLQSWCPVTDKGAFLSGDGLEIVQYECLEMDSE
ncbi:MAG: hypothetical protein IH942_01420 [Acidobacteria bacterium]|nr:hypothetical protein [Acidobacteriota bacterium]